LNEATLGDKEKELFNGLEAIYAALDGELNLEGLICKRCGQCCDFDAFGHRLYISNVEWLYLMDKAAGHVPPAKKGACPWFTQGQCTIRNGRTLGCRIYSCAWKHQDRMEALYEKYLSQIKDLTVAVGMSWSYESLCQKSASCP